MADDATKNMAEVADKAVDKLAAGVEQLAAAARKVAPQAWDIMVHQQRIEGSFGLATDAFLVVSIVAFCIWAWRANRTLSWQDPSPAAIITIVGSVASLIAAIVVLSTAPGYAMQLVNPEYYAAMQLLAVVK